MHEAYFDVVCAANMFSDSSFRSLVVCDVLPACPDICNKFIYDQTSENPLQIMASLC